MARIDVLVPCHQYGKFLPDCIGSLQQQGVEGLRILIIDDASTDDSLSVAHSLAAADSRVEVIHHPTNRGHITTYNEGIAWAAAEYFLLLSADDLLVPGALSRAMSLMDARPDVSFTYGKDHVLDTDGDSLHMAAANEDAGWHIRSGEAFIAHVCRSAGNPVPACTAIVRTAAQKQAGPYRAHLPHAGDLEMWLRLAMLGAVAATDTVQGIRRLHGANMSDAYVRRMIQEFRQREAAFDSFFAGADRFLPHANDLRRQTRGGLATQACRFGLSYFRKGHGFQGVELLRYALALDPLAATATPLVYLERVLDGHFGLGKRLPQPRP
jgi:glycosyltransferase involved in cell wall biosynthesis